MPGVKPGIARFLPFLRMAPSRRCGSASRGCRRRCDRCARRAAAGHRVRDAGRPAAGVRPLLRDRPRHRRRAVRLVVAPDLGTDERAVARRLRDDGAAGRSRSDEYVEARADARADGRADAARDGRRASRRARQLHLAHGDRRLHRRARRSSSSPRSSRTSSACRGAAARNSSRACTHSAATSASVDPRITATAIVTLGVAVVARQTLRRVPYMIVAMVAGSAFAYVPRAVGLRRRAHGRRAAVRAAGAVAAVVGPGRVEQARACRRSRSTLLGPDRGGVDRARDRVRSRASESTAARSSSARDCRTSRARSLGVSVVGLVQPERPQLRSRRAHAARVGVRHRSCCSRSCFAVAPLGAYLPLAVMAACCSSVAWGLIDIAGDPAHRAHEPRRALRARA